MERTVTITIIEHTYADRDIKWLFDPPLEEHEGTTEVYLIKICLYVIDVVSQLLGKVAANYKELCVNVKETHSIVAEIKEERDKNP